MALGSSSSKVARLILGQTGLQLTLGMAIGVGRSLLLGQGLSFVLFDVAATDGFVLAGVAALLTVTAVVACLVPVRRATKVDPLVAMQSE